MPSRIWEQLHPTPISPSLGWHRKHCNDSCMVPCNAAEHGGIVAPPMQQDVHPLWWERTFVAGLRGRVIVVTVDRILPDQKAHIW